MTPRDDLNAKTEAAHRLLARCRTEGRALLERAAIPAGPDGYPRRASGADPTAVNLTSSCPDDEGEVGRAISYSDPTGDFVTAPRQPDPVRSDARRFQRRLDEALRALGDAVAVLDYQRVVLGQATPSGDEERWCQSCARDHGYREPVWAGYSTSSCRWCYSFARTHHVEPPLSLLADRHAGKTIYDRDVAKALAGTKRKKAG